MTETSEVAVGPVVTMCGNPDCAGWRACPDWPAEGSMALAMDLEGAQSADDTAVRDLFAQELALSPASDSSGVKHRVPDGARFTVHRGSGDGACTAVCAWTVAERDAALATAPLYDPAGNQDIVDSLATARRLLALDASSRQAGDA